MLVFVCICIILMFILLGFIIHDMCEQKSAVKHILLIVLCGAVMDVVVILFS